MQTPVKVKKVRYVGKGDTYCMNVEKYHNFSVNDGLIVHNCMDMIRYGIFTHFFKMFPIKIIGFNFN